MFKLKFSIALLIFSISSVFSQQTVNDYKYVIVPVKYDFQKSEDSFQINSLMKFLFEKTEFEVYMSNDLPDEVLVNNCLALIAQLNDHSKMLSTKMNIDLVDCRKNVVYSTIEGKSKEKEFKVAYHECIREAFEEIKTLEYSYNDAAESTEVAVLVVNNKNTELPQNQEVISEPSSTAIVPLTTATVIVSGETDKEVIEKSVAEITVGDTVLYAQPTANGFQLVDSTPKVIYVLVKMNIPDVYSIKGHDGIVYKKDGVWKVDTYIDGKLVTKNLNIKFF